MPTREQRDRDYYTRRKGEMDTQRTSFISHWRDLSEHIQPRRGRFDIFDHNKGQKKHKAIINSHGSQSLRTAVAGLVAGTHSPATPWFNMAFNDPDLMEDASVKVWLDRHERLVRAILTSSNFYNMSPTLIEDLLLFGSSSMTHLDDFDDVARFYTHPVGSFFISQNDKFKVDTFCREFQMTVRQMVEKFGLENVSREVKNQWDLGNYDLYFTVIHFIEPNVDFNPNKGESRFKPFVSVYFEPGREEKEQFLRRSGFDEFPVYAPRWDVTGEDVWGTSCPGMISLGDVRMLQIQEKRKAQAIDKMVNPPLVGPASLRNSNVNSLPGGLTIHDGDANSLKLQPVYQVTPQIQDLREDIQRVENRIDQAFYADMFLAITNIEGIQPRNQLDLTQRNEERLLQLGPSLERIQNEFLSLVLNRLFNQAVRAGIVSPAPEAIQGKELEIRFVSTLAKAQEAAKVSAIERTAGFVSSLMGAGFEDAADKFDALQAVDEYSQALNTPPRVIVPDEVVNEVQAARSQMQQQQLALQAADQGAGIAQKLASADTQGPNALTTINDAIKEQVGNQ